MYFVIPYQPSVAAAITGSFLMFAVSTSLTWSSPVIPKLKDVKETPFDYLPSTEDSTWISSSVLLGATIGSIIFPFLADHIGRRITLICIGIPVFLSYLAMAFLEIVEVYYVARLLIGLSVGGSFSVVPVYIAEVTSKSNRAGLSTLVSFGVNAGCLFSYSLGPFVKVNTFNLILAIFPACYLVMIVLFGDETGHFYLSKGREEEARAAFSKFREKNDDIDAELKDMKDKLCSQSQGSVRDMLRQKCTRRAFTISIALFIFQQFSGINVILFYTQTIFEMSGSAIDAKYCPIILGLVQFISSTISIIITARFGRKPLLIASSVGMIVGLIPLSVYCYLKDSSYDLSGVSFVPVLGLAVVALMYNIGVGPLPWAIIAEIFPSRVKALGTSVATFLNWSLAFLLTKYFESMTNCMGLGTTFLVYGIFSVICIFFVAFFVVETKGKTLEEIQDELML